MATTDDLVVSIRADVSQLQQQLNRVDQQLNDTQQQGEETGEALEDSFSGAADALKNLAATIGAAAAALGAMAVDTANNVREFNSLANSLGLSYRQLERLQSISSRYNNLELDTMIDLAKTLNEQIGEAANGNKDFEESFNRLGLSMDQLLKLSVDEQLLTVADALGKVSDQSDKAQIGATLFGDNWLPALKLTEQNVKQLADEYEKFGKKVDDTDVTRLIELDKAFDGVVDNISQISKQVSSELAPALTVAAKKFNELLGASDTSQFEFKMTVLTDLTINFSATVVNVASIVKGSFELMAAAIATVAATLGGIIGGPIWGVIDAIASSIGYVVKGYQELYNVYARFYNKEQIKLIEPPNGALFEGYLKLMSDYAGTGRELFANGMDNVLDGIGGKAGAKIKAEMEEAALASGGAADETENGKPKPKDDAEALKKIDELKKAAQEYLNQIAESAMTEQQLEAKHYQETIDKLNGFLSQKLITREQYNKAEFDLFQKSLNDLMAQLEQREAIEAEAQLKQQEREDEARTNRISKIQEYIEAARQGGLNELELMDAQHAEKMARLAELAEGEQQFKDELRQAELDLEAQHQAKRLDLILGTGRKIQELQKAFQKGALDGALSFFAADFGGFSQHSRKMFELQKAAKTAQIILATPATVSSAIQAGWAAGAALGGFGAPALAAAYGTAALAQQLGQLRAIQSASFSGGGGGSGGGAVSVGSATGAEQSAQQPIQQRFVNVQLSGSNDTMYSRDSVLKLMQRIGEEVKDGATLRVI